MSRVRKIEGDEPGFNGITRNQQVGLLTDPFRNTYEEILRQYVRGRDVLEADIPDSIETHWMTMVDRWQTRTSIHLNGFDETGSYLQFGKHNLIWVPENTQEHTYKFPLHLNSPTSLVRAAEVIFEAQMHMLGNEDEEPVKQAEVDYAMRQGNGYKLQLLTLKMIAKGQTSGITLFDVINHPFSSIPFTPDPPKPEPVWSEEQKKLVPQDTGFKPHAVIRY